MLEKTEKWLCYCAAPLQCGLGSWVINTHDSFTPLVIDIVYFFITVVLGIVLMSKREKSGDDGGQ